MRDDQRISPDPKKVEKVVKVLIATFPSLSDGSAMVQARALACAPEWGDAFHHAGGADEKQLKEFMKSNLAAARAIHFLSEWSYDALETALHREGMYDARIKAEGAPLPQSVDELKRVLDRASMAADAALQMMLTGRASHGKNWRAIALIHEARKAWQALTGRPPPKKKLNPETKFARFLEDLFEATNVGMGVARAYDAWYDYAKDPNSLIDL